MTKRNNPDLPRALFVATRHGTRYTLVCLPDGTYGIAADGQLLPPRWQLRRFDDCFRFFMDLSEQPRRTIAAPADADGADEPLDLPAADHD